MRVYRIHRGSLAPKLLAHAGATARRVTEALAGISDEPGVLVYLTGLDGAEYQVFIPDTEVRRFAEAIAA